LGKSTKKFLDGTLGWLLRTILRYGFLHPLFLCLFKIEIDGEDVARSCTKGAIIAPNHVSYLDGPFLMSIAWILARIRFVVWHAEYSRWYLWPIMKLCGAISAGSPKHLPKEERARRKANTLMIMDKVLKARRALGIFPSGHIGDGVTTVIQPHLAGLYDLISNNPDTPLLLVSLNGLQYSRMGKCFPKVPLYRRLPVKVVIRRFDNVSLEGGPEGLNKRLEDYFNHGIPLLTNPPHLVQSESARETTMYREQHN